MKNLTRIFFAVAAIALASCVTDATDDLDVQFGNGGDQTVIALSLEESRTQLGEKAGHLYPVFWSEGDKISVNGVESCETKIDEANKAKAWFTVESTTLEAPYCIAYPAAPKGQVLFAAEQVHTSNTTFGDGVSTMYGFGKSNFGVGLKHLTGVLKVGIVGEATLTHAQISTLDRAPIAGLFDIDFETGEIAPSATATATIDYSFGEAGVALSAEPTYIHVAVPAGSYDELYITLYDNNNGVMYAKVAAGDSKPLAVGKVREFSNNIPYIPSDKYLAIKSVEDLKAFAAAADTLEQNVVLANDIDMTGEDWTPIEGYAYNVTTTAEGDTTEFASLTFSGNGFAIKGLSAPLFGTTGASIKGVHLTDLDMTINKGVAGALVCLINNPDAVVEHCSVSGNITFGGEPASTDIAADLHRLGGIVGYSYSTKAFTNLVSYADITASGKYSVVPAIASIVGTHNGSLADCTNLGSATFNGETIDGVTARICGISYAVVVGMENCTNGSATDPELGKITLNGKSGSAGTISGIVSYASGTMNNVTNYGKLEVNATVAANLYCAGIANMHLKGGADVSNSNNYGDITVSGSAGGASTVGGVVTYTNTYGGSYTNCHNYGNIEFTEESNIVSTLRIGGLIGCHTSSANVNATLKNCTNHGNIKFSGTTNYAPQFGGFSAYWGGSTAGEMILEDCANYGNLEIGGKIEASKAMNTRIGGFIAVSNKSFETNCKGILLNKGNITCTFSNNSPTGHTNTIGGCIGATDKTVGTNVQLHNEGDITVKLGAGVEPQVGGILGNNTRALTGGRCFCNIVTTSTKAGFAVGYAYSSATTAASNTYIGGTISKDGGKTVTTLSDKNYIDYIYNNAVTASVAGSNGYIRSINADPEFTRGEVVTISNVEDLYAFAAAAETTAQNVELAADLDLTGMEWTPINGFGSTFYGDNHTIKGLTAPLFDQTNASIYDLNLTDVNIVDETRGELGAMVCTLTNEGAIVKNCSVSGKIESKANEPAAIGGRSYLYYGGMIGFSASKQRFSDLTSDVELVLNGTYGAGQVTVGGVIAMHQFGALEDITNLGSITFNGKTTNSKTIVSGGITFNCASLKNCTNGSATDSTHKKGAITLNGESNLNLVIAGICCNISGPVDDCNNYGALTSNCKITGTGGFYIGGIFRWPSAEGDHTVTNCSNYGPITVTNNSYCAVSTVSGIMAESAGTKDKDGTLHPRNVVLTNCNNYGDITLDKNFTNKGGTLLGGILARAQNYATIDLIECTNYGTLTMEGTNNGNLYVGGFTGIADNTAFSYSNVYNRGDINIGGTVTGLLRIGGFYGALRKTMSGSPIRNGNAHNYGTITCTTNSTLSNTNSTAIADRKSVV